MNDGNELKKNEYTSSENTVETQAQGAAAAHAESSTRADGTQQAAGSQQAAETQQTAGAQQAAGVQQPNQQSTGAQQPNQQPTGAQQPNQQAAGTQQPNQQTYSWMQQRQQQNNQTYENAGQQGYRPNGQQYQQTAWNSQPHYNYYQRQQTQQNMQHAAKKSSGSGTGRRWGAVVAMALVFGLIAGTATYGVNRAANALFPSQPQTEAAAPAEEKNEAHLSVTGSGTAEAAETQAAPAAGTKTVAQVASECMPALVTISTMSVQEMRSFFGTQQFEAQGAGTGVIVGENDTELLIATNNHVIEGAQEVSIGFIDESVSEAQIKGTDAANDLAVVAVKLEDIPEETMDQIKIVAIGDSDELVLGDQVVAIGNALGVGQSVTSGYVSALDRELDLSDGYSDFKSSGLIQTDAAINSGNSGGALLNMKGELIGINEAKSAYTSSGVTVDNVGYAIPMSKAQPILEELMNQETREKYSEDEQGYLGVSLVNVGSEFAELYGTPEGVGFAEVAEGSPAAEAGAMKGDILTEFNGKTMTSVDDVMNEIKYYRSGEEVELTVLRADNGEYKEVTLTVTLGTKDAISTLQTQ